ncbi:hypothetical protein Hgul01_03424 [Herpetosiphon gulosus]|uniref:Uncharacterized protein n=1 Tax=Herpetosiphon gulosus TaxID=1973496 RepID=A0ABP9X2H6_9CHLR
MRNLLTTLVTMITPRPQFIMLQPIPNWSCRVGRRLR